MSGEFVGRLSRLKKLCPHFHLSLQSGSTSVLARMKRRYSAAEYLGFMERIRKALPDAVFTTDIIVGFPGETEEEFRETCGFVRQARFAHVHIFPYSRRPGTPAADMPEQLTRAQKHARLKELESVCSEVSSEVLSLFAGKELSVLTEYINPKGLCEGYSENYLRCEFPGDSDDINRIVRVRIVSSSGGILTGEKITD